MKQKNTPKYIPNPKYSEQRRLKAYFGSFKTTGFSNIEIKHLFWAWLAISIAFANVLKGSYYPNFFGSFLISAIAVGTGFLFHELAHKIVAQKYKLIAEFRAFFPMLLLAVIISFFGVVFAAPGAVMILGRPTKKQNGLISLAGPTTNVVLSLLFFFLLLLNWQSELLIKVLYYGYTINVWIGLFNLIPIAILDGRKIFDWNKAIWAFAILVCLGLIFMQGFLVNNI